MRLKDLTSKTPVEIDTELARIHGEAAPHFQRAQALRTHAERVRDPGPRARFTHPDPERANEIDARADEESAKGAEILKQCDPLNAEFQRRGGWNRYYLVTNTGGHVHREMSCTTCYPTTVYNWLIDLADCDETEMVAEHGERACTVCFPDAPSMKGWGEYAKRVKADKQAEKDAKKQAKIDAGVVGTKGRYEGVLIFKTERAAEIKMVDHIHTAQWYAHAADRVQKARDIADALAAKHGTDAEEILAAATEKATKKTRKLERKTGSAARGV